jgi:hypothetical protein
MSAVVDFQNTTWVDTTGQLVFSGPAHVTAIEVQPHSLQATTVYVHIYDSVTAALGGQAAILVVPVVAVGTSGAGTNPNDGSVQGGVKRTKAVFPGRGIQVGTGILAFVSTTLAAFTAATTTSLPPMVRVFFAPDHV